MKLPHVLFAFVLAMIGVLAICFYIGESSADGDSSADQDLVESIRGDHGFPHPQFATMQQGGDGAVRHGRILWFGLAFGLLQVVLFVCLIALGGRRDGQLGPLTIPLVIGGILYAGAFTAMVITYRGYMSAVEPEMFGALPLPTAWMIYGVWPVPIVFMLIYMLTFDIWIYRPDDQQRLEGILAEQETQNGKPWAENRRD